MSERNPGEITGYADASRDSVDPQGKPVYFGGGKLAADPTLPKLRRCWDLAVAPGAPLPTPGPAQGTGRRAVRRTGKTAAGDYDRADR